ncbi:hypothetical protein FORC47_5127 [Bacillus cereus]|nr:hypothetical protein FORC47_5127 [Bacillus cereus]
MEEQVNFVPCIVNCYLSLLQVVWQVAVVAKCSRDKGSLSNGTDECIWQVKNGSFRS